MGGWPGTSPHAGQRDLPCLPTREREEDVNKEVYRAELSTTPLPPLSILHLCLNLWKTAQAHTNPLPSPLPSPLPTSPCCCIPSQYPTLLTGVSCPASLLASAFPFLPTSQTRHLPSPDPALLDSVLTISRGFYPSFCTSHVLEMPLGPGACVTSSLLPPHPHVFPQHQASHANHRCTQVAHHARGLCPPEPWGDPVKTLSQAPFHAAAHSSRH